MEERVEVEQVASSASHQSRRYGLSPMQAGMVFQSLLETSDETAGYDVEQLRLSLRCQLQRAAFAKAWTFVARRHPNLLSSFHFRAEGEPYQIENPDLEVPVEYFKAGDLGRDQLEAKMVGILRQDRLRGFRLDQAPLMRVKVLEWGLQRSEVIWTFHHILLDGRSIPKVLLEVFSVYEALVEEQEPELPPSPRAYADYIDWLGCRDSHAAKEFFRDLLRDKDAPTPVPLAEPSGKPLRAQGYAERVWAVAPEVRSAVQGLADRTGTTVGTVVQAAWSLVLSRFTGETDVLFGSTRSGRSALDGEAARMVGLFINTVPTRAQVDDDLRVTDLLERLRAQSIAVRPHEAASLVDVTRASEMSPGVALFETLLMFENRGLHQVLMEQGGEPWRTRGVVLHEQPAFPLTATVFDGTRLEVRVLYDRRRFLPSSVERLGEGLIHGLRELARDPERRLGEIEVISDAEQRKLLFEWNDTERAFSETIRIHELFEARAQEQPQEIAVEVDGQALSYRSLEDRANRIANAIRARGIGAHEYVGICLSRGLDLVVALIGVEKSGAAYVPLDPEYPKERLDYMLSEARAGLVVTEERYRHLFDGEILVVDGEGEAEIARAFSHRPDTISDPNKPCYAIFTSGSTGTPKGVVLSHRAVINTLEWVNRTFEVARGDRLLFVTSPCFDLSVYDVFGALGAGATVVIATEDKLADPERLAAYLVDAKITIWDSAPAALQRLAPFFPMDQEGSLRLCMLSGDWIPLSLPDAVRGAFPGAEVKSLGGATEAAIWSNWFPVGAIDQRWSSIPYGRPIQNARYHVLDRRMKPVPVGVAGELYIGGVCLAEGYLNRDDLTRDRFIDDPFRAGQRLYRTGDLARYFEDGNLEFLGRTDFQVKIRGFRIEMGEVEAVVAAIPGVRVAVCMAYSDASNQKSLAAYVVPKDGVELDEASVKAAVAEKLPSFMVPTRVLFLDVLPTSKNGKLDRRALPNPQSAACSEHQTPPSGALEEELVRMWCSLLQIESLGTTDNFFALGGHSLLAVMLLSRIKERFGADVPLAELLANPTVASLSQVVQRATGVESSSKHLQSFHAEGSLAPLVLIPGVVGTAFTYRSLPHFLGPEQPIHVVDLLGMGKEMETPDTVEEIAATYEPEISALSSEEPIVLGGFSFGALVAFELAHRLRLRGRHVPLLICFDGFAPGYPRRLPLPERTLAHVREFLGRDGPGKKDYLKERSRNVQARFARHLNIPLEDQRPTHELSEHMRHVRDAQRRAQDCYRPSYKEDCALLLIRAEESPSWVATKMDDPLHGWRDYITGPISLLTVPGSHLRLWDDENQGLLAGAIIEHLARFVPGSAPMSRRYT